MSSGVMTRAEFAKPWLIALYREHRRDGTLRPSLKELARVYDLPRDSYMEGELYEYFSGQSWAHDPELSTEVLDARLSISMIGKMSAESYIQQGIDVERRLDDAANGSEGKPGSSAPASDRIVRFDDNLEAAIYARAALCNLSAQLVAGNDIGNLTNEEVAEAKREVWLLQQAISQGAVRVEWIESAAKATLHWIAEKAAEQIVGALAVTALGALAALVGFS